MWKEWNIQTCHPVLAITLKCSKFEKAIISSKMTFSFSKRKVHIFNMSATTVQKLEVDCLKTVGGVDHTNFF